MHPLFIYQFIKMLVSFNVTKNFQEAEAGRTFINNIS